MHEPVDSPHLTEIEAPEVPIMAVSPHIMGNGRTARVAALVVLLSLLVPDGTAFSTARSSELERRGLLDSADTQRTIAADLMHVHHVDSPYMQGRGNLTLRERVQHSVANSRRRLQSTYVFTSPLKESFMEYTMQITVGTPARTFVAIADTGSDLVWLQCSNSTCTDADCIQTPDQPFDPSASNSSISIPCYFPQCGDLAIQFNELPCPSTQICEYNYSYGDGTFTSGVLLGETFTFTSPDGSKTGVSGLALGCGIDDESMSSNGTDGLVGLGQGPLSLPSQLASASIITHVFSYCLVDYTAATTQTSPLLLGSTGAAAKSYTPLLATNGYVSPFYYVNLVGITVNGKAISYPPGTFDINSTTGEGGLIVDSGTTFTTLSGAAFKPFHSAISANITYPRVVDQSGLGLDPCYNISGVSKPVFPVVVFQFENVNVTLGMNNTFVPTDDEGTYCLAFSSAPPQILNNIYGNIQQSHFEISFDIENLEVGFGPGAC